MMLQSRQRFGATAVAATGGIRNTTSKLKNNGSPNLGHHHNKSIVNPAKLADRNALTKIGKKKTTSSTTINATTPASETKIKTSHDNKTPESHDPRTHNLDTKTNAANPNTTSSTTNKKLSNNSNNTTTTNNLNDINPSEDDIIIHVCDESRKVNRDFKCSKQLLLKEMKYFESYLSSSNQYDDIDISVHCDVYIFEWLMRFINRPDNPPELKCKSAVSILISSEFLRMQRLVDLCLQFVHDNINNVIKLPIDLNCINNNLVGKLSLLFTIKELESIEDRRDKLKGKLWMKHVEKLLENKQNVLQCCSECGKIYSKNDEKLLTCKKARPYIDFHGNVISNHKPLITWKMRSYVQNMRSSKKMEWRSLYWKLWGMFHLMRCTTCNEYFPACEYGHCVYHPEKATFSTGSNRGVHSCCGTTALRFDTTMRKTGCRAKNHTPENVSMLLMEEDGTEVVQNDEGAAVAAAAAVKVVKVVEGVETTNDIISEGKETNDAKGGKEQHQMGEQGLVVGEQQDDLNHDATAKMSGNSIVNTLIRHLDLIAVVFSKDAASGGYEEDRIAGLVNGDKTTSKSGNNVKLSNGGSGGSSKKGSQAESSKNGGSGSSSSSSSSSNDYGGLPRRPSKNGSSSRSSRPSTASSGRRRDGRTDSSARPSTTGRYGRDSSSGSSSSSSSSNSSSSGLSLTAQPHNDTYRGGVVSYSSTSRRGSSVIAGQSVTTPEAFRVNPQRRRMWKLDLQREKDTVRINALVNKLETLRKDDLDNNEQEQFQLYSF